MTIMMYFLVTGQGVPDEVLADFRAEEGIKSCDTRQRGK